MIISLFLLTYIVNAFILSLMVIQCCHLGPTSQGSNKTYCISVIQLTNCSFLVKVWWTEKINNRILQICWCFSNKSISYSSRHSHCGGIGFTWKLYFIIVYFLIVLSSVLIPCSHSVKHIYLLIKGYHTFPTPLQETYLLTYIKQTLNSTWAHFLIVWAETLNPESLCNWYILTNLALPNSCHLLNFHPYIFSPHLHHKHGVLETQMNTTASFHIVRICWIKQRHKEQQFKNLNS